MHRKIAILLIASVFVVSSKVYSEKVNVLKCYMCNSLSEEKCGSSLTVHSLQPQECTNENMIEWQNIIKQHVILESFIPLFEVAESLKYHNLQPMACAKMIFYVRNQNVTVRTCQMAETEDVHPCQTMNKTLKDDTKVRMEKCTLCLKEACNGTIFPSPETFYIFLAFLGTLIYATFYH